MTKKDLILAALVPLNVVLATKVFLPQLWPLGLVALTLTFSTAMAIVTLLVQKYEKWSIVNYLLGGLLVITLSFIFGKSVWPGIPIMTIVCVVCIIYLDYASQKVPMLSFLAIASYFVITSCVVLSWAASSSVKWTVTLPHLILMILVSGAAILSFFETVDSQSKEN